MRGADPQRTCLGCRRVRPRAELIRLVRDMDGRATVDWRGGASGRGTYACPDPECLSKALGVERLSRAFRRATRPPEGGAAVILATWLRR